MITLVASNNGDTITCGLIAATVKTLAMGKLREVSEENSPGKGVRDCLR